MSYVSRNGTFQPHIFLLLQERTFRTQKMTKKKQNQKNPERIKEFFIFSQKSFFLYFGRQNFLIFSNIFIFVYFLIFPEMELSSRKNKTFQEVTFWAGKIKKELSQVFLRSCLFIFWRVFCWWIFRDFYIYLKMLLLILTLIWFT